MAIANDSGVRPGILTTEFLTFAIGGVLLIVNGTTVVDIPWDTLTGYLALGGVYMGGRAIQKTVGTYANAKAPVTVTTEGENRRDPTI